MFVKSFNKNNVRQIYGIIILELLSISLNKVSAQCGSFSINEAEKISQAEVVFEGRVIEKYCYKNEEGNIFTANKVEIISNSKGSVASPFVDVITPGGMLGDKAQFYFPGLNLQPGERGIFYCTVEKGNYFPVGLSQGFTRIESAEEKSTSVQINSISPLNVTAGTQTPVIITGTNFGAEQGSGKVSFRNADNGGANWVAVPAGPHYLMWNDTVIKMLVPTYTQNGVTAVGSGTVKITTSASETAISPQELHVHYALNELVYNNTLDKVILSGMNASGGYTFKISPYFSQNTGMLSALQRALNTWRCNTGINIAVDTATTPDFSADFNDGLSSVSLSNTFSAALATTVISVTGCSNEGQFTWQMTEADIIFNLQASWYCGVDNPGAAEYDFESAALHELGHAHLEQHNNHAGSVMYYKLNAGEVHRTLDADEALEGGVQVMFNSLNPSFVCNSFDEMIPLSQADCSVPVLSGITENSADHLVQVFPNPSQGTFTVDWKNFEPGSVSLRINNQLGECVWNGQFTNRSSAGFSITLSAGVYFVILQGEEKILSRKIIIQ